MGIRPREFETCVATLIAFVLFVGYFGVVDGFAILAKTNAPVLTNNGTLVNNKTIFTLFSNNDFGTTFVFSVAGTDSISRTLSLTAQPTERPYSKSEWGICPSIGKLRSSRLCQVISNVRYNDTLPSYVLQDPTGRQLLSFFDSLIHGAKTFVCTGGLGTLGSSALGTASAAGADVCGGSGGVSQDQLDLLNQTVIGLQKASDAFGKAEQTLFANITNLFQDVVATTAELQRYEVANQRVTQELGGEINATHDAMVAIATAASRDSLVIHNDITDLNVRLNQLTSTVLASATSQSAALAGQVVNMIALVNQTNTRMADLSTVVNTMHQSLLVLIRYNGKLQRDSSTNFELFITRSSEIIYHTSNLQLQLAADLSDGILGPFLYDLGIRAVGTPNALGAYASLPIDNVRMTYTYINPTDSQPWAVLTTMSYTCSSLYVVTHPYQAPNNQDIAEFMGPVNCSATQEGSGYCNCWMAWNEQQCPIITSSSGTADSTVYDAFRASTAVQLSPSFCQGSIVTTTPTSTPSGLSGVASTSFTNFVSDFAIVGARGTCSSNALVNGACVQRGYSMFDNQRVISGSVPYSAFLANGDFFAMLMSDNGLNVFNTLFNWVRRNYGLVVLFMDTVQEKVFGTPPDGCTQTPAEYHRNPADQTPQLCDTWSYMAYGIDRSTFAGVGIMRPGAVIPRITVQLTGSPTAVLTTNIILSNAFTYLLPDYKPYYGDPYSSTTQYNPADSEIVISPNPQSREGKLTYAVTGDYIDFRLPVWENVSAVEFNHPAGSNVGEVYLNNIDPTTGLCVPVATANVTVFNGGNWCAMREQFFVLPNPGSNYVSYVGKHDQMLVNIAVPEGELVQLQGSACPQITSTVFDGDGGMILTLQNTQGGTVPNHVTYQVFSTLCPLTDSVDINPLSKKEITVAHCAQNPPGVYDTLYFFYTSGTDLIQCPDTVNITSTLQDIPRTTGPGSLKLTETLRTLTSDTSLIAMHGIATNQNIALLEMRAEIANLAQYIPIPDPVAYASNQTAAMQKLRDLQIATDAAIATGKGANVDYTTLIAPYETEFFKRQNESYVAWIDAQRSADAAGKLVVKEQDSLAQFTVSEKDYLVKSMAYRNATLAFAQEVQTIFTSLQDKGLDFSGLGSFLSAVAGLGKDALDSLIKFVESIPGAVADFLTSTVGKLLNSITGAVIVFVALGMGGLALLGVVYLIISQQRMAGGGGGGGGYRGSAAVAVSTGGKHAHARRSSESAESSSSAAEDEEEDHDGDTDELEMIGTRQSGE